MISRAAARHRATHACWTSASPTGLAGGLIVLVSQTIAPLATHVEAVPIVPGRVLRLTLRRSRSDRLDLVNVHNGCLTTTDRRRIQDDFRAWATARCGVGAARLVCGGDFNFDAGHAHVTHVTAHPPSRPWPRSMGAPPASPAAFPSPTRLPGTRSSHDASPTKRKISPLTDSTRTTPPGA